ncbi:hypothetical protein PCE1_002621 [Barthelona sp. PCE]
MQTGEGASEFTGDDLAELVGQGSHEAHQLVLFSQMRDFALAGTGATRQKRLVCALLCLLDYLSEKVNPAFSEQQLITWLRRLDLLDVLSEVNMEEIAILRPEFRRFMKFEGENVTVSPFENLLSTGRFQRDFIVMNTLGKGAFGSVFQVRNRIDGCIYAVKRIPFKQKIHDSTHVKMILREIRTLSSLNHPNVVRYFGSWIELSNNLTVETPNPIFDEHTDNTVSSIELSTDVVESQSIKTQSKSVNAQSQSANTPVMFIEDSKCPTFVYSDEEDTEYDSYTDTEISNPEPTVVNDYSYEELNNTTLIQKEKEIFYCFYLQMSFNGDQNLSTLLHKRKLRCIEIVTIFTQIFNALEYIHNCNVIHRDIKPANVLVSDNMYVSIVDFGLSRPFSVEGGCPPPKTPTNLQNFLNDELTSGIGTLSYLAPEVMDGEYTSKADVYSTGVMFVECICRCVTRMDLHVTIKNIKKGVFPDEIRNFGSFGDVSEMVMALLEDRPELRPSAKQVSQKLKMFT